MQTMTSSDCVSMLIAGIYALDEKVRCASENEKSQAFNSLLQRNGMILALCAWSMGDDENAGRYSGFCF